MEELNISATLLDAFDIKEQIGESNGIYTYHVKDKKNKREFVLKHLSFPASDKEIEALRYTGAIPTDEDAKRYYEQMSEDYLVQLQLLDKLSESINLANFSEYRIEQKESGIGFDLYLLSPMRETLEQFLARTPMQHLTAVNLAIDLCSALSSLRECGLIHCNIKPSNVYLNEQGHFMLGDLGLYKIVNLKYASVPDRMIGAYSAPELFDVLSDPTETTDIYSIGLILYNIYNGGHNPFEDEENPQKEALQRRIQGDKLPAPIYADYELTEILLKACAFKPEDRFQTPEELRDAFSQYVERNHLENTMIVPPIVTDEDTQLSEEAMNEEVQPLQENVVSELDETFVEHFSPDISAQPENLTAEQITLDDMPEIGEEPCDEQPIEPENNDVEEEKAPEADDESSEAEETPVESASADEKADDKLEEEPVKNEKKKKRFPVWAWILCGLAVLVLAAGVTLYFLTPQVNDVSLKDRTTESITLTLDADCTAADITMYATDSYGNVIVGEPDGQDLLFRALNPATQYTFHIETLRGYPVRGAREYTATTLDSINILYFTAKPVSPTQAEINFNPAGGDSESWHVTYTNGTDENYQVFTGHSVTLTDLTPDSAYTMTLATEGGLQLTGQTQLSFNNSDLVKITGVTAVTTATQASVTWEAEGEPAGSWTVLCYEGDMKKSEQTVEETTAVLSDLEEKHEYLVEIYTNGMKRTARKAFITNGTNLSDLKAEINGGTAVLTWNCEPAIPEGYQVTCKLDDLPDATETAAATDNSATFEGLLPNCRYRIDVTAANGEILGGTNELTLQVPDAGRFTRYGFSRSAMRLYQHPGKEGWNADDLKTQTGEYAKGDTVAFAVETLSKVKKSKDAITINYVVVNANGSVVDFGTESKTWNNIFIGNLYVGDTKRPLEDAGAYTLEIYFDRQLAASQTFTVV